MASLRDQFEHFYALDENAKKTALQTGLVTPGTNVLLHLYRFQAVARDGKHSGLPFGLWLSLLLAGWHGTGRGRAWTRLRNGPVSQPGRAVTGRIIGHHDALGTCSVRDSSQEHS
jgi:hypothetical protein